MLNKAEKYQKTFERLEIEDYQFFTDCGQVEGDECDNNTNHKGKRAIVGAPLNYGWEKARVFVKLLKLFCDATLKFSATKHVTSNSFVIELIKIHEKKAFRPSRTIFS